MANTLDVGDLAPDFTLPSTRGEVTLSEELKEGPVLLVFYPGDDTPVCTRQLCNYRDNLHALEKLGLQVLALNPQSETSHERFTKRHDFPFPLVSDPKGVLCRRYGALNLLGMAKRALVLVGRDGRIKWRRTDFPVFYRSADDLRDALSHLKL